MGTKGTSLNFFFIALLACVFSSCSSKKAPVDFWSGNPNIDLGLDEVTLSQEQKAQFGTQYRMAEELLAQDQALLLALQDTANLEEHFTHWVVEKSKKGVRVHFGVWRDSLFDIELTVNAHEKAVQKHSKSFHLPSLDIMMKRVEDSKIWLRDSLKLDSLSMYRYLLLGTPEQQKVYWIPYDLRNQLTLGGIYRFYWEGLPGVERLERNPYPLGEKTHLYPEEIRYFNFRVVDEEGIPDAGILYQTLRNRHYFPTQYLHTGKYIWAYYQDEKNRWRWKVLDPKGDVRFKLREQRL